MNSPDIDVDPFALLNVIDNDSLTDNQVRAAYRSAALLHPDKVHVDEAQTASALFNQIQRAAAYLSSDLSRWCYRQYGPDGVSAMSSIVSSNPFLTDDAVKRLVEQEIKNDDVDDCQSLTQLSLSLNLGRMKSSKHPRSFVYGFIRKRQYVSLSPFYPVRTPVQAVALTHSLRFDVGDVGYFVPKLTVEPRNPSTLKLVPGFELSLSRGPNRFEINPSFDTLKQRASVQLSALHSVAQHGQIELSLQSPPDFTDWSSWLTRASLTFSRGALQLGSLGSLTVAYDSVSTSYTHALTRDGRWTNEIGCSVDADTTSISSRIGRTIGKRKRLLCFAKVEIILPHEEPVPPPSQFHHRVQLGLHYTIKPANSLAMWVAANENGLSFMFNFRCPAINLVVPVQLSSRHTKQSIIFAATIPFVLLTAARATFLFASRRKRRKQLTKHGQMRIAAREALEGWCRDMRRAARRSRSIELDKHDGLIIECAFLNIDTHSPQLIRSIDLTAVLQASIDHLSSCLSMESIISVITSAPVSPHFALESDSVLHIRWRVGSIHYVGEWRIDESINIGADVPPPRSAIKLNSSSAKAKQLTFHDPDHFW